MGEGESRMSLQPPHGLRSQAILFLSPENSFHNVLEYAHSSRGPALPSNMGAQAQSACRRGRWVHAQSPWALLLVPRQVQLYQKALPGPPALCGWLFPGKLPGAGYPSPRASLIS